MNDIKTVLRAISSAVLIFLTAIAQSVAGPYEISGIEVETSAQDAVTAKANAIAAGQAEAARMVLQRITTSEQYQLIPELSREELEQMINGFSVEREQASATTYSATLTFHFSPQAVQDLLARNNIPFSDRQAAPTLLVPIFQEGENFYFMENNPHLEAWRSIRPQNQLTPFILPAGDISDAEIDPNALLARNIDAMSRLRLRYQAQNVLIALCRSDIDSTRYDCTLEGGGPTGPVNLQQSYSGDDPVLTMAAAARAFVADIENQWKSNNLISGPGLRQGEPVQAAVSFNGLSEWQQLRGRLASLPEVSEIEIKALNPRGAVLVLHVTGGVSALGAALSQYGYELADAGGTWMIRPRQ